MGIVERGIVDSSTTSRVDCHRFLTADHRFLTACLSLSERSLLASSKVLNITFGLPELEGFCFFEGRVEGKPAPLAVPIFINQHAA